MMPQELCGERHLTASASNASEVAFTGKEPDPNGVSDWLNGQEDSFLEQAQQIEGLVLSIFPDGRFTEQVVSETKLADMEASWYDAEGVLLVQAEPFDGVLIQREQSAYLIPDMFAQSVRPDESQYGTAILRYDDGDTKISDCVHLLGDHLIRTLNVVTDELYLDRVLFQYRRAR